LATLAPDANHPVSFAMCRANADFIAQLIAIKEKMPQMRARRRAEPGDAVAAYGAVGQWPVPSGRRLSRSL
jgi:hypothetical protein